MSTAMKAKIVAKRLNSTSRRSDIERAMMELRRLKRSATKKDLNVVVSDGVVVVKGKVPAVTKGNTLNQAVRTQVMKRYQDYLVGLNHQMRTTIENSHNDRERIVRTLKEQPSKEALEFYANISKA